MENFILYSPPGRAQKHEFCAGDYTTQVGLPCCVVPPPSHKEVGENMIFYDWADDSQSLEKKVKLKQWSKYLWFFYQCNFHCYKVILNTKHFGNCDKDLLSVLEQICFATVTQTIPQN